MDELFLDIIDLGDRVATCNLSSYTVNVTFPGNMSPPDETAQ